MTTNYLERLKQQAQTTRSIICMGIDPQIKKIQATRTEKIEEREVGDAVKEYYINILRECERQGIFPASVKPNLAYFEEGRKRYKLLEALDAINVECRRLKIPIIGDAKRGDIGASSEAYAEALFHPDEWNFDAVTVAPYMGTDSIMPFVNWCDKGKGVYILLRTSNPGRKDIQDVNGTYRHVAELIGKQWYKQGIGAVFGGTGGTEELEEVSGFYVNLGREIPLLIPGIGKQGGSLEDVIAALKRSGTDLRIHRINASSDINWAWEKEGNPTDYAGAAVRALMRMNGVVGL
ncbi:orotidine-5'-phosphate decarboxylase [Candidatus Woesearchaeota archaeon]|nr:orotidine-5'-phosphate decarboxylase [Candidatus Woesearchaeota archaeon]